MNLSEFHFIRPYLLLALLPYAVLLVMLVKSKLSHGNWAAVCDEALLPYLLQDKAVSAKPLAVSNGCYCRFVRDHRPGRADLGTLAYARVQE